MRKITFISVLIFAILSIGLFIYIKSNPPLISGTIGTSGDKHTVVVVIGNKGFSGIKITKVLINNNELALDKKIQINNPLKGFIISDSFEEKEYNMKKIDDVNILPNTSPSTQLEKVNNGTASENDKSYGLTVLNNKPINEVIIHYNYLGLNFEKSISIND